MKKGKGEMSEKTQPSTRRVLAEYTYEAPPVERGYAGQTLYVMEVQPAAYAALAANEAEKAAYLNILEVRAFGSFGRVYLGGEERDIMAGYQAAVDAVESVSGRVIDDGKNE